MRGAYLLKSVDKGMVSFVCVFLLFRALHCLQPTVIFSLLERSSRLNVTFVLTL